MKDLTLDAFTMELASSAPTPGGGGASALAGAVAVSLGHMVGSLTVGKEKYANVEAPLRELMEKAKQLRIDLLSSIEKDAKAFEPLSKAYAIPKDDPDKAEVMEKCLKDAAAAPLEIFDYCCQAIELIRDFGMLGSKIVISDAATGSVICSGAMKGAAINVLVNTRLMADRDYAESVNKHITDNLIKYSNMANETFDSIYEAYTEQ